MNDRHNKSGVGIFEGYGESEEDKVSNTPPPITEEMLEAGLKEHWAYSGSWASGVALKAIYLAMNAARSNQEATPDADVEWLTENAHDLVYGGLPLTAGIRIAALKRLEQIAARLATPVQEATRTVGDAEVQRVYDALPKRPSWDKYQPGEPYYSMSAIREILRAYIITSSPDTKP